MLPSGSRVVAILTDAKVVLVDSLVASRFGPGYFGDDVEVRKVAFWDIIAEWNGKLLFVYSGNPLPRAMCVTGVTYSAPDYQIYWYDVPRDVLYPEPLAYYIESVASLATREIAVNRLGICLREIERRQDAALTDAEADLAEPDPFEYTVD